MREDLSAGKLLYRGTIGEGGGRACRVGCRDTLFLHPSIHPPSLLSFSLSLSLPFSLSLSSLSIPPSLSPSPPSPSIHPLSLSPSLSLSLPPSTGCMSLSQSYEM